MGNISKKEIIDKMQKHGFLNIVKQSKDKIRFRYAPKKDEVRFYCDVYLDEFYGFFSFIYYFDDVGYDSDIDDCSFYKYSLQSSKFGPFLDTEHGDYFKEMCDEFKSHIRKFM